MQDQQLTPETGSLSHGTMIPADLASTFLPAIRAFCPKGVYLNCAALWLDAERDNDDHARSEAVESMFDALNDVAPEGTYFGAHEGDGSDYGFWEIEPED